MGGVLFIILILGLPVMILTILIGLVVVGVIEIFPKKVENSQEDEFIEPFRGGGLLGDDTLDLITMGIIGPGRWDRDKTSDIEIHYADNDK